MRAHVKRYVWRANDVGHPGHRGKPRLEGEVV